jgi:membrane protease YdiL (CAAX protease family)
VGIVAILLIIFTGSIPIGEFIFPLGALLVLLWVKLSHTPWKEIGYKRPRNIFLTISGGIIFGIALKFLMKAVVMPLLGADPVNHTYHYLAGNRSLILYAIWAMLVAGFGEETIFRGFIFERIRNLIGWNKYAKIFTVIFTSVWFGLAHYTSQGITGVEQATIVGLVLGSIFARTKSILFIMIAHAFFDLTAYTMIYFNMETAVAHLLFR